MCSDINKPDGQYVLPPRRDAVTAFVATLPIRKVPGVGPTSLKSVLRAAVGDLLPAEEREAPKWGFNVPLDTWFRGSARGLLDEHLNPEQVARRGVFDPKGVRDLLRRFDAGRADANTHIFPLLVFEVWAQRYLDP